MAQALHHVGAIDAGGRDLDQDLALGGGRYGAGRDAQLFRAAGLGDFDAGHFRG